MAIRCRVVAEPLELPQPRLERVEGKGAEQADLDFEAAWPPDAPPPPAGGVAGALKPGREEEVSSGKGSGGEAGARERSAIPVPTQGGVDKADDPGAS
jgi:hypothetical protein